MFANIYKYKTDKFDNKMFIYKFAVHSFVFMS